MKKSDPVLRLLLDGLDEAFETKSWHGTNLRGSVRGLSPAEAAWRPAPGRHNIWEIAVHAAYWKYAVRHVITGAKRGSFPLQGSNWFLRDGLDAAAWRQDLQLLTNEHRQLREAVATLSPASLELATPKRAYTFAALVRGVAAHDLYHAGQIQLLKRLRVTAAKAD